MYLNNIKSNTNSKCQSVSDVINFLYLSVLLVFLSVFRKNLIFLPEVLFYCE